MMFHLCSMHDRVLLLMYVYSPSGTPCCSARFSFKEISRPSSHWFLQSLMQHNLACSISQTVFTSSFWFPVSDSLYIDRISLTVWFSESQWFSHFALHHSHSAIHHMHPIFHSFLNLSHFLSETYSLSHYVIVLCLTLFLTVSLTFLIISPQ